MMRSVAEAAAVAVAMINAKVIIMKKKLKSLCGNRLFLVVVLFLLVVANSFVSRSFLVNPTISWTTTARESNDKSTNLSIPRSSLTRFPTLPKPSQNNYSSVCYSEWDAFVDALTHEHKQHILYWTVSGGPDYREYSPTLLKRWRDFGINVLVVALEVENAMAVCQAGYDATLWTVPAQTYSRVADAKFQFAARLASEGVTQFFVELDIFCNKSPVQYYTFLQNPIRDDEKEENSTITTASTADLVLIGHRKAQELINIGLYFVRPSHRAVKFFQILSEILRHSKEGYRHYAYNISSRKQSMGKRIRKPFFDQETFHDCLNAFETNGSYWTANDEEGQIDLLEPCKRAPKLNLTTYILSNEEIVCDCPEPPVGNNTICIHPLENRPLSSFYNKLAIAKYTGFDPTPALTDQRPLLKIADGDQSIEEARNTWCSRLSRLKFTKNATNSTYTNELRQDIYDHFAQPLSILILLAQKTNRTIVLPRHLVDCEGRSFPFYAMLKAFRIDQYDVTWRHFSPHETQLLERYTTVVVEMPPTMGEAERIILNQCQGSRVCAFNGLYRPIMNTRYGRIDLRRISRSLALSLVTWP